MAAYAAGLKAMEFIAEGVDRSESARIITTRPGEVCAALSETCGCGIMGMDARGWYADSEKSVVYIVVNRFRIPPDAGADPRGGPGRVPIHRRGGGRIPSVGRLICVIDPLERVQEDKL